MHEPEPAASLLAAALDLARTLDDARAEAVALQRLGYLRYLTGNYDPALELFGKALALYGPRDLADRAETLSDVGLVHHRRREIEPARRSYEEALALARQAGDPLLQATALVNRAGIDEVLGNLEGARGGYEGALPLLETLGRRDRVAAVLHNLGAVARAAGDYRTALQRYQRALEIWRQLGDRRGEASTLNSRVSPTGGWARVPPPRRCSNRRWPCVARSWTRWASR